MYTFNPEWERFPRNSVDWSYLSDYSPQIIELYEELDDRVSSQKKYDQFYQKRLTRIKNVLALSLGLPVEKVHLRFNLELPLEDQLCAKQRRDEHGHAVILMSKQMDLLKYNVAYVLIAQIGVLAHELYHARQQFYTPYYCMISGLATRFKESSRYERDLGERSANAIEIKTLQVLGRVIPHQILIEALLYRLDQSIAELKENSQLGRWQCDLYLPKKIVR